MEIDEKTRWDRKHNERSHSSLTPDPLLVNAYDDFLSCTTPGKALDLAGGVGRHAIWLAERGWQVRLLDISDVGIQQAKENARLTKTDKSIITEIQDLDGTHDFGSDEYDLILGFFFLQRKLFPVLISALKPQQSAFLLQPNELLHAFSSMRVLHYHETIQEKGVAELVARK